MHPTAKPTCSVSNLDAKVDLTLCGEQVASGDSCSLTCKSGNYPDPAHNADLVNCATTPDDAVVAGVGTQTGPPPALQFGAADGYTFAVTTFEVYNPVVLKSASFRVWIEAAATQVEGVFNYAQTMDVTVGVYKTTTITATFPKDGAIVVGAGKLSTSYVGNYTDIYPFPRIEVPFMDLNPDPPVEAPLSISDPGTYVVAFFLSFPNSWAYMGTVDTLTAVKKTTQYAAPNLNTTKFFTASDMFPMYGLELDYSLNIAAPVPRNTTDAFSCEGMRVVPAVMCVLCASMCIRHSCVRVFALRVCVCVLCVRAWLCAYVCVYVVRVCVHGCVCVYGSA